MEAAERARPRTYGNWRKPVTPGLGRLGTIGTGILLVALIVVILTMLAAGMAPAFGVAAAFAVLLSLLMVRDRHDKSWLELIATRIGYARARGRGSHLYRSGPLGFSRWGRFQLPGLAAPSRLTEWRDSYRRAFALLEVPATAHFTVVLATAPDGASLVDEEQVDVWVAHWGQWLAVLGNEPGVVAASVTVETAPDTGMRLRQEVQANLVADAPDVARQMLEATVRSYPRGSATVTAWVALTFSGVVTGGKRRSAEEVGRELATRLPGLTLGLQATGAGACRPVSAQELCELIRVAYEPAAVTVIEAAYADGYVPELTWTDVGPAAAEARWDYYRHDGAFSVAWTMTSAPRGEVHSSVLSRLLAPHADIDRKRVTLLYRPIDAARASRIVEQDKRAASFRATGKRPSVRAIVDQRAAVATAQEEAQGAGLTNFGMIITATVGDVDRLGQARATIDSLAATARIMVRPAYGSQDSAFAAGLPLGLVLPKHLMVPSEIREAL